MSGKPRPEGKADNGWRRWVRKDGSTPFAPEAGRYLLYSSAGCPYVHRVLFARAVKGLEKAIEVVMVNPIKVKTRPDKDYMGFAFDPVDEYPQTTVDPVFGVKTVQDFYEHLGDFDGPFSVPILFDTKTKTIVNNESADLVRMFNSEFDDVAERPNVKYTFEELLPQIDEMNAFILKDFQQSCSKAGQAVDQQGYDEAIARVVAAADRFDSILSKQRYLLGETFTECDIRIFPTLITLDACYVTLYKLAAARVRDRPHLFAYLRELYQMPGVKDTVLFSHIIPAHWKNNHKINPNGIVGIPPVIDYDAPHGRDALPAKPLDH